MNSIPDRPLCNFCKEGIREGQIDLHKEGACLVNFYEENGRMVLNESYLLRRGRCCNRSCKNCPY